MRIVPLALRASLFVGVGLCFCMPKYVNSQDLCFWTDTQGNLRDLSSMCGKKSDDQSEIKATSNNPSNVDQSKATSKVQVGNPRGEKGMNEHRLNLKFVPDGSPTIIVQGNQEYHAPDGSVYRGNGMMTTPEGINVQMIVQDGKIVGQQYYRTDGSKLMPGESITTNNGIIFKQKKL
jgi:hypothetical protein